MSPPTRTALEPESRSTPDRARRPTLHAPVAGTAARRRRSSRSGWPWARLRAARTPSSYRSSDRRGPQLRNTHRPDDRPRDAAASVRGALELSPRTIARRARGSRSAESPTPRARLGEARRSKPLSASSRGTPCRRPPREAPRERARRGIDSCDGRSVVKGAIDSSSATGRARHRRSPSPRSDGCLRGRRDGRRRRCRRSAPRRAMQPRRRLRRPRRRGASGSWSRH